ncbi:MAG TPA: hypothetical protein VNO86_01890 [Candidatus Binatia bacterium]|nr:hypothetical protein [Candidatus Binatia bacterium]
MTGQPHPAPDPPARIPPRPPLDHRAHDPYLTASLLDPDLAAEVRAMAEAQVASCRACAELLADLRAIAAATAELPVPPRRRDFRLTAEDAARLRPRGLRRLVAALAAPRLAALRPLGAAMATLGLAGLLLTGTPAVSTVLGPLGVAVERDRAAPAAEPDRQFLGSEGSPGTTMPPTLVGEPKAEAQGGGDDVYRAVGRGPDVPVSVLFGIVGLLGVGLLVGRLGAERAVRRRAPPG